MEDVRQTADPRAKAARMRMLFFDEAADLLLEAERCLQASATGTDDAEVIGPLFRCVHTIKGAAASLHMGRIVAFTHILETVLEELRQGRFKLDPIRRHMLLRSLDMIGTLLSLEEDPDHSDQASRAVSETELVKALEGLLSLCRAMPETHDPTAISLRKLFKPRGSSTVRVEVAELEKLKDLIEALALAKNRLQAELYRSNRNPGPDAIAACESLQGLRQLEAHIGSIRETAIGMRSQPLNIVFQRLPCLVRELGEQLQKPTDLTVHGGDVEVDKIIIEQLIEPLGHLLRNAVDHGIEPVEQRRAQGKPAMGAISITAKRRSEHVVITVADDGAGLDWVALTARHERLHPGAPGTPCAVAELIFRPGLTTRDQVTNLSGRGVGLDAVRHALRSLDGTIRVSSSTGAGTVFTIILPLKCGGDSSATPPPAAIEQEHAPVPESGCHVRPLQGCQG